jgi:anti-sigma factor RsiW
VKVMKMNCPLESRGGAGILTEYSTRKAGSAAMPELDRHIETCPACRRLVSEHQAVWTALDAWKGPAITGDFDQRLYASIAKEPAPWWRTLIRPLIHHRGLAAATAALCVVITAGVVLDRPEKPAAPAKPEVVLVDVQADQVEQALDTMDVISEFNHKARAQGGDSRL